MVFAALEAADVSTEHAQGRDRGKERKNNSIDPYSCFPGAGNRPVPDGDSEPAEKRLQLMHEPLWSQKPVGEQDRLEDADISDLSVFQE